MQRLIDVGDDNVVGLVELKRLLDFAARFAEQRDDARLARRVQHALLDRTRLCLAAAVGTREDENNFCCFFIIHCLVRRDKK